MGKAEEWAPSRLTRPWKRFRLSVSFLCSTGVRLCFWKCGCAFLNDVTAMFNGQLLFNRVMHVKLVRI